MRYDPSITAAISRWTRVVSNRDPTTDGKLNEQNNDEEDDIQLPSLAEQLLALALLVQVHKTRLVLNANNVGLMVSFYRALRAKSTLNMAQADIWSNFNEKGNVFVHKHILFIWVSTLSPASTLK